MLLLCSLMGKSPRLARSICGFACKIASACHPLAALPCFRHPFLVSLVIPIFWGQASGLLLASGSVLPAFSRLALPFPGLLLTLGF